MTLLLYKLRKERALVENTDTVGGRLTGRVALVAGAASGIGRATTLRLAREGDCAASDVVAAGSNRRIARLAEVGGVTRRVI